MASKLTLEVVPSRFIEEETAFTVVCELEVRDSVTTFSNTVRRKFLSTVEIASVAALLHKSLHFSVIYVDPHGIGKGVIDCLRKDNLPVQEKGR